ncbi:hypothetical protein KCU65_g9932, partial [Aureobasidium melanogenum]
MLLGDDELPNKATAEFYFYEALRHVASHMAFRTATYHDEDIYIPCEALKLGLLPVLHITGLCSPQPLWLEFIKDMSGEITQEGVLKLGSSRPTTTSMAKRRLLSRFESPSPLSYVPSDEES